MTVKIKKDEWHEPILTARMFGRAFEVPLTGKSRVGWTLVKITGEHLVFLSPRKDRVAKYPWLDSVLDVREPAIHPLDATEKWISSPPCTVTDAFVADHCTVEFID